MMEKKRRKALVMVLLLMLASASLAVVDPVLSIYDVQYTTDASGDSPYFGQRVNCAGGIVVNKWIGGQTKLPLYDPANSTGWGGIIAKTGADTFDAINVGDWVSFDDVLVDERSGNTQLSIVDVNSTINVESTGNAFSVLNVTDAAFSEMYESMYVTIGDPTITAMGLGYYGDNYNLLNTNGNYWVGDYMNTDVAYGEDYHDLVAVGADFLSISGILEHKIKGSYDYYQMITTGTGDFVVPEPATMALLLFGAGAALRRKRQ